MDPTPPKISPKLVGAIRKILNKGRARPTRHHQGPFSLANIDNPSLYQQHYIDIQQPFHLAPGQQKSSYKNNSPDPQDISGIIHKASPKIDWAAQEDPQQAEQYNTSQPPEN